MGTMTFSTSSSFQVDDALSLSFVLWTPLVVADVAGGTAERESVNGVHRWTGVVVVANHLREIIGEIERALVKAIPRSRWR